MLTERALGSIGIGTGPWVTRDRNKLTQEMIDAFDGHQQEAILMLATLVFDALRRLAYVFEATMEFAPFADPELVSKVLRDQRELKDADSEQDYKRLALKLQKMNARYCRDHDPRWRTLIKAFLAVCDEEEV